MSDEMRKKIMQESLFLSGVRPVWEDVSQPDDFSETEEDLVESNISINEKLKGAEWAFLGSVTLAIRKYLKQMHRGLKFEVNRMPAVGGGGSIGGVKVEGKEGEWELSAVVLRKGDKWHLQKSGTMSIGIKGQVQIKDTAKVHDLHPESIAMGLNAIYSALVEKNEDARQRGE